MAQAFQVMLKCFSLKEKILTVNADNVMANDKQTTKLDTLNNSFEEANQVRCFNHTLQLSVKALLVPFNTTIFGNVTGNDEVPEEYDDNELLLEVKQDDGDGDGDGEDDDSKVWHG